MSWTGATVPAPPSGRAGLVVSVGRLIGIKDPATVVAAFVRAARPEDQLVMVGEGELRSSLELYARRLPGEGGVFFTGLVPREEVHETLHCADVFVSASTVEGLPVAVLEAMVCRCLVVLSDIPAHREIASRTPFVQLVAPGDVAGFARAIRRIADMRPAARLRAGEELRSCAVQHYSVRRMNVAYGHLYASIARGRTARRRGPAELAASAVASPTVRKVAYVGTCALLGAGAAFGYGRLRPPAFEADVTLAVADSSEPLDRGRAGGRDRERRRPRRTRRPEARPGARRRAAGHRQLAVAAGACGREHGDRGPVARRRHRFGRDGRRSRTACYRGG